MHQSNKKLVKFVGRHTKSKCERVEQKYVHTKHNYNYIIIMAHILANRERDKFMDEK